MTVLGPLLCSGFLYLQALVAYSQAARAAQPQVTADPGQGGQAWILPDAPAPKVQRLLLPGRRPLDFLSGAPDRLLPCRSVSLSSDSSWFTSKRLQEAALYTPEFMNQRYLLVDQPEAADVSIYLGSSNDEAEDRTHFLLAEAHNSARREEFSWPEVDAEIEIGHKMLVLLSSVCKGSGTGEESNIALPALSADIIDSQFRSATHIRPVSRASQMDVLLLQRELESHREFADWGTTVTSAKGPSGIDVVVSHVSSSGMWKFTLIDQGTGSALDSGTLFAFEDKRAASRIATAVISRIRARRPLPGASSPSVPSLVAAQSGDPQKPREWRIKLLSEEPTEQPENALRLSLEDGRLVAKTGSGVAMFSIPTADLVDVALGKRRDLSLGATMALDAETVQDGGANCGGDGHAEICALGVAVAYPILWTVDLSAWVLGHMKTPHHVIRVAWRENGAIRTAEWKIFKGDWKALFATLDALAVLR